MCTSTRREPRPSYKSNTCEQAPASRSGDPALPRSYGFPMSVLVLIVLKLTGWKLEAGVAVPAFMMPPSPSSHPKLCPIS